jgi:hypothetical protein
MKANSSKNYYYNIKQMRHGAARKNTEAEQRNAYPKRDSSDQDATPLRSSAISSLLYSRSLELS